MLKKSLFFLLAILTHTMSFGVQFINNGESIIVISIQRLVKDSITKQIEKFSLAPGEKKEIISQKFSRRQAYEVHATIHGQLEIQPVAYNTKTISYK